MADMVSLNLPKPITPSVAYVAQSLCRTAGRQDQCTKMGIRWRCSMKLQKVRPLLTTDQKVWNDTEESCERVWNHRWSSSSGLGDPLTRIKHHSALATKSIMTRSCERRNSTRYWKNSCIIVDNLQKLWYLSKMKMMHLMLLCSTL